MLRITKETTLAEILKEPGTEEILKKFNLPCLSCPFAEIEMKELKIGAVCEMYGIDIKKILKELNKSTGSCFPNKASALAKKQNSDII